MFSQVVAPSDLCLLGLFVIVLFIIVGALIWGKPRKGGSG